VPLELSRSRDDVLPPSNTRTCQRECASAINSDIGSLFSTQLFIIYSFAPRNKLMLNMIIMIGSILHVSRNCNFKL